SYTREERDALIRLARSFDQLPVREYEPKPSKGHAPTDGRPGDDFNRRASWSDLLPDWPEVYRRGDVIYLRRPGKDSGHSATLNARGTDRFHCFTSSTIFEKDTSYSKFGVYTVLEHGGDFSAAARALAAQGYGEPRTATPHATAPTDEWPDPLPMQHE